MNSIWPQLEPLLAKVQKPARYIGCEDGAQQPDHHPGRVAWLLIYPDTYEIGLPNQGLQILYEILNERPDALAERTYAPWVDLEALLRAHDLPLFSVDTHRPAGDFDLLAFNLSAELVYTNLLNCIDLAGVPVRAAERRPEHPLVVRRRALHLQPRAAGRLPRRGRARRRRGGRRRDHRGGGRVEGVGPHRGLPPAGAAAAGPRPGRLRALDVRRHLRRRAPGGGDARAIADVPGAGREAHHRRPGRLALPQAPARAAHRGRARPPQRRGLPRLHARAAASARPA